MRLATRLPAKDRFAALMGAWKAAAPDDEVEVRHGTTQHGESSVMISINGTDHVLTKREVEVVIGILKSAIEKFPGPSREEGIPLLIEAMELGVLEPVA